jgi:hypothetical protein
MSRASVHQFPYPSECSRLDGVDQTRQIGIGEALLPRNGEGHLTMTQGDPINRDRNRPIRYSPT